MSGALNTVPALVDALAEADPDMGLTLHTDPDAPELHPWRQLHEEVRAAADGLRSLAGQAVLVPMETDWSLIVGFLGLVCAGAKPFLVKPYLFGASAAEYQRTLATLSQRFDATHILEVPSLAGLELPLTRVRPGPGDPAAPFPACQPEDLAFVQFSSGSTADPKGVPVTHGELLRQLQLIVNTDQRAPRSAVVSWLPLYHDMGLVGGFLTGLVARNALHLWQPAQYLMDPIGWWRFVADVRAMGTALPDFALRYALRRMEEEGTDELKGADFSGFQGLYLGSEPIHVATLRAFFAAMAPFGMSPDAANPCYGMAEAVLMVTCNRWDRAFRTVTRDGVVLPSNGPPCPGYSLRIEDEEGRVLPEGEPGEICVSGGTVVGAYHQGELIRQEDGYFRTGDLGFLLDGELYVQGRIGDRLKVNGQSFFASDLEFLAEAAPEVRTGRVVAFQLDDSIHVLAELSRPVSPTRAEENRERITRAILDSLGLKVQSACVHFVRWGSIEKTSSGKLRRRAMVARFAAGEIPEATWGGTLWDLFSGRLRRGMGLLTLRLRGGFSRREAPQRSG